VVPERLNEPDNLILLCRVHHKMVDDQTETFTSEILKKLKSNHERWVSQSLDDRASNPQVRLRRVNGQVPTHLIRIRTGAALFQLSRGTLSALHANDEPANKEEADLLSGFFEEVQDWGDIIDSMEAGAHVQAEFRLSEIIKELEDVGFWVFGGREIQQLEGGEQAPSPWPVFHLSVLRDDSPRILRVSATEPPPSVKHDV